ncbi:asparagine synthetase B, partial [bacterium]|nr:asparagine synthetase B [bacterium]
MCGICGKLNRHPENPVDPKLIEKMCDVITHRGPDDAGYYVEKNVGLGMRRLSIIDLSGGHQPIYNEDKTVVVVLNGEIYNFPELRERLTQQGHVFQSQSDTEVIVHLYEEVGEACVKELRGMFGFALYDLKKQKLMVARDRMGIKPIYYAFDNDKLLFGSELKSLIQDRTLKRELDYFSLNCYFSFMNTVAPDSIFQSVKRLMPGQYMVYEKDRLRVEDYWDFELTHSRSTISEEDAVQELLEKLR